MSNLQTARRASPILITAMVAFTTVVGAHVFRADVDPSVAPPTQLELDVAGKTYVTTSGEPVVVDVGGQKITMTVRERDVRRFNAGGVSFDFPADMGFEYDGAEQPEIWTLDGNNCVIMVTALPANLNGPQILERAVVDLGNNLSMKLDAHEVKQNFGGKSFAGKGTVAKISTIKIGYEFYLIPTRDGAVMVSLQETLEQPNGSEVKTIRGLFDKTFEVTK